MLKLRTEREEEGEEIRGILTEYRRTLNLMLQDICQTIQWTPRPPKGKKQARLLPTIRKDKIFMRGSKDAEKSVGEE